MFCHHNHEHGEHGENTPDSSEQIKHCQYCKGRPTFHGLAKLFLIVLIIFFSLWSVESIVNSKLKSREIKNIKAEKTLSVNAEGKVVATPDLATINFSVMTEAKTAKEAQSQNTDKMNNVVEYLKSVGIDKKDIKTTSYYLSPKYNYPDGRSILVGYILTNSINIKVRDFDILGDLMAKSVDLGINQIGDAQFSIENPDALKAQAGELAIKNAKEKARTLSMQAGVRLGKIITFSENESSPIYPYYMKTAEMGMGGGEIAPQLEQGSQEIKVTANIIFEIE